MSVVSLLGVNVMDNPAKFTDKYSFEITFECLEQLEKGALKTVTPLPSEAWLIPKSRSGMEVDLRWFGHLVRSTCSLRDLRAFRAFD